ncbi:MAG TPA: V-type ATP synthase subunit D [Ruminococcaceae bacterium]|nr:V-type ATP synthase subunit D [Oscillospiraceae bacterium]
MAENVFPTKGNLMNARRSLELAKVGFDLMERKRKFLLREIAKRSEEYEQTKKETERLSRDAFYALRLATIADGLPLTQAQSVPVDDSVSVVMRSVMGVEVPEASVQPSERKIYYGLSFSGLQLDEAYSRFTDLKELSVKLASLETALFRLQEAVVKTGKRSNALGNIVIPKFTSTVKFISDSLEEKEREDFARLKVIKGDK